MKNLTILTIVLSVISFTLSAQTNISGTYTSNDTLDLAGSPYTITANVFVNTGVTLTVDSGVVVKFNSARRLYIYGTMNARYATFTSSQAVPAKGDWSFIQCGDASNPGSITMNYCQVLYGTDIDVRNNGTFTMTNTDISDMDGYAFDIYSGGLVNATNSTISASDDGVWLAAGGTFNMTGTDISSITNYGIRIYGGVLNMNNSNITGCDWPVYYNAPADWPILGTCDFTGNTHDGIYMNFTQLWDSLYLSTANVPYYFHSGFIVNIGAILEIATENIMKFGINRSLDVHDVLIADALVGDNIFFTSYYDDNWGGDTNDDGPATAPASRNWYGVKFFATSDDSRCVMRRCMLRYAGTTTRGGVEMENAGPTIDLCDFSSNYFGVSMHEASNPVFTNNIIGSSEQTPIAMSFEANPVWL